MKKRGNIVYLAGPMTNCAEFNRPAFHAAEAALAKNNKYVVINPAKLPIGLRPDDYMPICLQMINAADMICLLDGWEHSAGARLGAQRRGAAGEALRRASRPSGVSLCRRRDDRYAGMKNAPATAENNGKGKPK